MNRLNQQRGSRSRRARCVRRRITYPTHHRLRQSSARRIGVVLACAIIAGGLPRGASAQPAMYAVDSFKDELIRIDLSTGASQPIGPVGFNSNSWGLAFTPIDIPGPNGSVLPAGTLLGIDDYTDRIFRFDLQSGHATMLNVPIMTDYGKSMAIDAAGNVYVMEFTSMYRVDLAAGRWEVIGDMNFGLDGVDVTPVELKAAGGQVIPAGSIVGTDNGSLHAFDPVSKWFTDLGKLSFGLVDETLAIAPDGTLYGLGYNVGAYQLTTVTLDPLSASVIGSTGHDGLWGAAIIPEPASALTASMLAWMVRSGRRRI